MDPVLPHPKTVFPFNWEEHFTQRMHPYWFQTQSGMRVASYALTAFTVVVDVSAHFAADKLLGANASKVLKTVARVAVGLTLLSWLRRALPFGSDPAVKAEQVREAARGGFHPSWGQRFDRETIDLMLARDVRTLPASTFLNKHRIAALFFLSEENLQHLRKKYLAERLHPQEGPLTEGALGTLWALHLTPQEEDQVARVQVAHLETGAIDELQFRNFMAAFPRLFDEYVVNRDAGTMTYAEFVKSHGFGPIQRKCVKEENLVHLTSTLHFDIPELLEQDVTAFDTGFLHGGIPHIRNLVVQFLSNYLEHILDERSDRVVFQQYLQLKSRNLFPEVVREVMQNAGRGWWNMRVKFYFLGADERKKHEERLTAIHNENCVEACDNFIHRRETEIAELDPESEPYKNTHKALIGYRSYREDVLQKHNRAVAEENERHARELEALSVRRNDEQHQYLQQIKAELLALQLPELREAQVS